MEEVNLSVGEPPSKLSAQDLAQLNESKNLEQLIQWGGVQGIARVVRTNLELGLTDDEINEQRIQEYGQNVHKQAPQKWWIFYFFEALKDTMLIVLMVLAVVSIILGLAFPERPEDRPFGWIEGAAIISAVLIVSMVASTNDWSKERKFRQLNQASKEIKIKVIRNGKNQDLLINDLLVGDLAELDTGDQVPADGIIVECHDMKVDESVMTGETDAIKKTSVDTHHHEAVPFMLSGCQVVEGYGKMLVTAVGPNSEWGKTLAKLSVEEDTKTPLEEKLDHLAGMIGKFGVGFAVFTFVALCIGWLIKKIIDVHVLDPPKDSWGWHDLSSVVNFIVIAVTIVVVAVPEGLPLAVTISLAYSVKKMMKDNNLVRHLAACETMGGATNICSDKTGTLTLNQMRVTQGWFGGQFYDNVQPQQMASNFNQSYIQFLSEGISINSKANLIESSDPQKEFEVQGNKTESALLILLKKNFGVEYKPLRDALDKRVEKLFTFSSLKKRMSTIVKEDENNYRLHCKGASEIILNLCNRFLNCETGQLEELDAQQKDHLLQTIETMASQGLRTLCLAYRDMPTQMKSYFEDQEYVEQELICLSIVGIKDPVRPEVPPAVEQCKKSGIFVRMVTGDNILTAKHIARECGILDEDGICLEGPVFRQLSDQELDEKLPRLQVLARSSPTDKYRLVKRLIELGEVVAVTGDGTNDAPALKEADVGLSMGLSGTQVAKEASDIIILDDNFKSIVRSVLWGRTIFENIRKFLVFQLTVNVVALILTMVTALTSFIPMSAEELEGTSHREPPLTAVQLLWVNLIMDTFAALALATEPPILELLDRKPYGRKESLITPNMWITLLSQALYQLVILFGLYYSGVYVGVADKHNINTLVFNSFVMCQIFNEFNARKINNEFNIFANLHKSFMFIVIFVITIVFQVLIVMAGYSDFLRRVTQTVPLTWYQWCLSIGLGILCIPFGMFIRVVGRVYDYLRNRNSVVVGVKQKSNSRHVTLQEEVELQ